MSKSDLNDALQICSEMKKISGSNQYLEGITYRAIGFAYRRNSIFPKAYENLNRSIRLLEGSKVTESKEVRQLCFSYMQLGWAFFMGG